MTDLRSHYEAHGQGHVFAHFDSLSATEQQALLEQAGAIDLAEVDAAADTATTRVVRHQNHVTASKRDESC